VWYRIRGADDLGRSLAEVRRAAGLTQAQLAELIRAERTTVLNMEAGRPSALDRIVRAFGLLGYDLIAVRRGSTIRVEEPPPRPRYKMAFGSAPAPGSAPSPGSDRTARP
jgi:transcriptional regulator with XRE-family HTH domain